MKTKLLSVWKSNHIVQASYSLTLSESRLILLVLAKLYQKGGIDKDKWYSIEVAPITWTVNQES